jgi:hypothetical protein
LYENDRNVIYYGVKWPLFDTIEKMSYYHGAREVMEYTEAVDIGDAPEIFISGIAKIEKIGPGTVRISFYSERDNCRRIVLHQVWDLKRWLEEFTAVEDARGVLLYGVNRIDRHVHTSTS